VHSVGQLYAMAPIVVDVEVFAAFPYSATCITSRQFCHDSELLCVDCLTLENRRLLRAFERAKPFTLGYSVVDLTICLYKIYI
jgi:hypothetical protein